MAAEKHKNPDQKYKLSFFRENPAQIQQYVRDTSQQQACYNQFCQLPSVACHHTDKHKAQRCQPFQNDCTHIVFFLLRPYEQCGKAQAEDTGNRHILAPFLLFVSDLQVYCRSDQGSFFIDPVRRGLPVSPGEPQCNCPRHSA